MQALDLTTEALETELLLRYMRPNMPNLAAALEVVTGIDRAVIDRALASGRWQWVHTPSQHGLAFVTIERGENFSHWYPSPRDRVVDPAEAFELFSARGIVPEEWLASRSRRFVAGQRGNAPASIVGAVAMAADAQGVAECERLAREFAARMAPWIPGQVANVTWRVESVDFWFLSGAPFSKALSPKRILGPDSLIEGLTLALRGEDQGRPWLGDRGGLEAPSPDASILDTLDTRAPARIRPSLAALVRTHALWKRRESEDASVIIGPFGGAQGTARVRSLQSPLVPLIHILLLGYVPVMLARRSVHLFACFVPKQETRRSEIRL
ncbi:MAG: hypothetical protein Q8Q09_26670 [Deltaproteobacteria bacterium]|nr:hypothetical protein [Deltaproteobacteria bacterium]